MSNSMVKSLEKSLQIKSLDDLERVQNAQNVILAIDCSGSMNSPMLNGKRRIDGLREVVFDVQRQRKTEMIAFSGGEWGEPGVKLVTDVPNPAGGTPMHEAIEFARGRNAGRLVIISDGEPNDRRLAIEAAQRFGGTIDIVFVGDENDPMGGRQFLLELAKSTGGTSFTGDLTQVKELSAGVVGLLTSGDDDDEDED